jgi:hypothetical protein
MDKPYHLSRQIVIVKNASQEEEGKSRSDVWLEGWPGMQLLFSITTTQKKKHYWK